MLDTGRERDRSPTAQGTNPMDPLALAYFDRAFGSASRK